MKRIILLLLVIGVLFLVACGQEDTKEAARATDEKVIKVGAVPDGFPVSYKEDDDLKGFSVDIIKEIAKEAGYEVEWVTSDWNGVLANLQSGKVDTAINFAATPERGETYNFTEPYYSSKAVIATAEKNDTLNEVEDIKGKDIASMMGTNFENVLAAEFPDLNYELITYESNDVVYTDIASGKIDGLIYGREQLLAQISERELPLRIVGEPFGDQPVALPFQKDEENDALIEELNEATARLKENGKFSEISLEYFDVDLLEDEK